MRDSDRWSEYGAAYRLGTGPIESCRQIWLDLSTNGWQIWTIFKSEFTATFRETVIGFFWSVVMPLVPLLAFFLLTFMRVFPDHEVIRPVGYMGVGVTLWLYMQGLVMAPTRAVEKHIALLKSSEFPIICMFVASYGRHAYEMVVRIIVVVPLLFVYYDLSAKGLAFMFVMLLSASAFCVAAGLMLGLACIVLQDVRNVAEIIFRYLIFMSFAVFPLPMNGAGWWVYTVNPFAVFIDNMRSMLMLGYLETPMHYLVVSAASIMFLVAALHLYHVLERRFAGAL